MTSHLHPDRAPGGASGRFVAALPRLVTLPVDHAAGQPVGHLLVGPSGNPVGGTTMTCGHPAGRRP